MAWTKLGVVGLAIAGWSVLPAPVVAQDDPIATVTPAGGAVDDGFELVVTCDEEPTVSSLAQFSDAVTTEVLTDGGDGTWSGSFTAGPTDQTFSVTCGASSADVRFDVDNPIVTGGPILGSVVTSVLGTDCEPGPAQVVIEHDGPAASLTAEVDEYGDWVVEIPEDLLDTWTAIRSTCGSVTYDVITNGSTATTTTSVTTSTAVTGTTVPSVTAATGATARTGSPTFTG